MVTTRSSVVQAPEEPRRARPGGSRPRAACPATSTPTATPCDCTSSASASSSFATSCPHVRRREPAAPMPGAAEAGGGRTRPPYPDHRPGGAPARASRPPSHPAPPHPRRPGQSPGVPMNQPTDSAEPATVLLVQDYDGIALPLQCCLERDGHHVERATSATEALARLRDGGVSLVVVDVEHLDTAGLGTGAPGPARAADARDAPPHGRRTRCAGRPGPAGRTRRSPRQAVYRPGIPRTHARAAQEHRDSGAGATQPRRSTRGGRGRLACPWRWSGAAERRVGAELVRGRARRSAPAPAARRTARRPPPAATAPAARSPSVAAVSASSTRWLRGT